MIIFDTSHDPLHLQAFPPVFTQAAVDAHFDEVEAYFVRRNPNVPTALLADARGAPGWWSAGVAAKTG